MQKTQSPLVRTETHFHTAEVSTCAHLSAAEAIRLCHAAGYRNVVVTDHMNPELSDECRRRKRDLASAYLRGYESALRAAKRLSMRVWLGMELRIRGGMEDYLIYGLSPDLLPSLGDLTNLSLEAASNRVHNYGLLIYQAHPYRAYLRPANPKYLDGAEVFNGNPRHDSHNDLALSWARIHGLKEIAGSDVHQTDDPGSSGILIPDSIETSEDFLAYLKSTHAPQRIAAPISTAL